MSRERRGHRVIAHTADVILEAWGPDVASCGEEAVAALVATFVVDPHRTSVAEQRVRLAPGDAETLLVALLEEVILVLDTANGVPVGATVQPARDGGLDVAITLADRDTVEGSGSVPKAVSRSGLRVEAGPDEVRARFLVDV